MKINLVSSIAELKQLAMAATPKDDHKYADGCKDCRPIKEARAELGKQGKAVLALIERLENAGRGSSVFDDFLVHPGRRP